MNTPERKVKTGVEQLPCKLGLTAKTMYYPPLPRTQPATQGYKPVVRFDGMDDKGEIEFAAQFNLSGKYHFLTVDVGTTEAIYAGFTYGYDVWISLYGAAHRSHQRLKSVVIDISCLPWMYAYTVRTLCVIRLFTGI